PSNSRRNGEPALVAFVESSDSERSAAGESEDRETPAAIMAAPSKNSRRFPAISHPMVNVYKNVSGKSGHVKKGESSRVMHFDTSRSPIRTFWFIAWQVSLAEAPPQACSAWCGHWLEHYVPRSIASTRRELHPSGRFCAARAAGDIGPADLPDQSQGPSGCTQSSVADGRWPTQAC